MRKIIFLIIVMTILGCNKKYEEKIVLTCGLGINPDGQRFGIEINHNKIFYCEEISNKKGKYNYFQSDINSEEFLKLKKELKLTFRQELILHDIVDAKPYQLDIDFNDDKKIIKFYYAFLNEKQINVIGTILKFKKLKFQQINFHKFPTALLNEKLPEPPPPPIEK